MKKSGVNIDIKPSLGEMIYAFAFALMTVFSRHTVYSDDVASSILTTYVRSFTILGERIYFVSGVPSPENPDYRPAVYCCDLDTMEVYNYIPKGEEHDYDAPYGESFIITDIHYDPATNLVAYGGCYWACPYDVIVLDFRDPMTAVEAGQWSDAYLECSGEDCDPDEILFESWDGQNLVCRALGDKPRDFDLDGKCNVKFV